MEHVYWKVVERGSLLYSGRSSNTVSYSNVESRKHTYDLGDLAKEISR